MEAQLTITGNVGTEVELKGGGKVAKFRLACTPSVYVKDKGWSEVNTIWLDVACFRQLAEHVAASLRKGDPVQVTGRLRVRTWERDGQTHERFEVEAELVSHDLTRGTAVFRRRPRLSPADQPDADRDAPPDDEAEFAGPSREEREAAQAA